MKKGKKFVALVIVFSLVVCSSNLFAKERKKFEINLSQIVALGKWTFPLGGEVSFGYYSHKAIGIELGGIIFDAGGAGVLSFCNVVMSPVNFLTGTHNAIEVIPYATGGLCMIQVWALGFNFGGGLKIRLNNLGIRAEFRNFSFQDTFDFSINSYTCGLSFFF